MTEEAGNSRRSIMGSQDGTPQGTTREHEHAVAIDAGMRRWYESCPCCLSKAYPEVKQAFDEERRATR
jgi:phage terminase large subunit GpA-like protein